MRESERERAFLDAVCSEVRWKSAHLAIREELLDHSEDQREALEKSGLSPEAAEAEALKRLGEPRALGMLFDASFRPAPTFGILLPIALYALLGFCFDCFSTRCQIKARGSGSRSHSSWELQVYFLRCG